MSEQGLIPITEPQAQSGAIKTTCAYCGVGCGIQTNGQQLTGDSDHPANHGALCIKGASLLETMAYPQRLLYPRVAGKHASWDQALDHIAERFTQIIDESGPEAIGFYVSGQLMTEDYYVANKLMKGYLGAANIDTNSRLCMSSAVMAHQRAFGEDVVPACYADLELCNLLVIVGANTAWTHPIVFRRIQQARSRNPQLKLVVIDPRKTMTAEQADLHLPLRPGSDVALFNGLCRYLQQNNGLDERYIADHVSGYAELSQLLDSAEYEPAAVAATCGVNERDLRAFYHWFCREPKSVTLFCQGVNQSNQGTDKGNSIINAHLLTGRVGKPGASPFSITGQPNAMGGREVGGLATQLAAHMGFSEQHCDRVQRFWRSPTIARKPGLKAVDLFTAVHEKKIRALWVIATNPAISLPDSARVREALANCELLIVSEMTPNTDTAKFADILLPAAGWGERGGTVTNSERCISRQRAFTAPPGEARPDWWALAEVGKRMGFAEAFAYQGLNDILREFAALTAFENQGERQLHLGELAKLSDAELDAWQPARWPLNPAVSIVERDRRFGDGHFSTPDGKARLMAVQPQLPQLDLPAPDASPGRNWLLNTGRLRDQWHTMTRTGHLTRLMETEPYPRISVNHTTLLASGLEQGQLVWIGSRRDQVLARLERDDGLADDEAFMPMHWSDLFTARGGVNRLVAPVVDPISGQPQFKQSRVQVQPFATRWLALWVGQHEPELDALGRDPDWWSRRPVDGGECRLLADASSDQSQLWQAIASRGQWLKLPMPGGWVAVKLSNQRIAGLLLCGDNPWQLNVGLLAGLLATPLNLSLLASTLEQALAGDSRMVCSCMRVSERQIVSAIVEQGIQERSGLQSLLKCGTNCGTCIGEIDKLVAKYRPQ
ncbi:molybdopterin-dependent oxidoreductase [Pseudaeromonas sharmana]|uniref:Molybdopterin-dependent oxidoreductase n=1 Tax=Pseudaeromonas sharmana TaxID=328412 RepID=A0ABV8CPK4_9GAMM